MKNFSFKNVATLFTALSAVTLLTVSCSSDDKDPDVVFSSLTTDATAVYVDKTIALNFEGTGYTEVSVSTSNQKVKIAKVASTTYEISSAEATDAVVYVELKNNSHKQAKTVSLSFAAHGILNYRTIEGIKVDIDKSDKVLALLGEPDYKSNSTDGLSEFWNYGSKGVCCIIVKSSKLVNQIDVYSSNYYYTNSSSLQVNYTSYPSEIGNTWKINTATSTMEMVVNLLGSPDIKSTASATSTNRSYQYTTQRIVYSFYSDTEDNYTGKKIVRFSAY